MGTRSREKLKESNRTLVVRRGTDQLFVETLPPFGNANKGGKERNSRLLETIVGSRNLVLGVRGRESSAVENVPRSSANYQERKKTPEVGWKGVVQLGSKKV